MECHTCHTNRNLIRNLACQYYRMGRIIRGYSVFCDRTHATYRVHKHPEETTRKCISFFRIITSVVEHFIAFTAGNMGQSVHGGNEHSNDSTGHRANRFAKPEKKGRLHRSMGALYFSGIIPYFRYYRHVQPIRLGSMACLLCRHMGDSLRNSRNDQ